MKSLTPLFTRSMKGGGITAHYPGYPEITGHGKTKAKALAELDKAMEASRAKTERREAREKAKALKAEES